VSLYRQVLDITRAQSAALSRGELETAVALLDDRAGLLADAASPSADEMPLAEEILRLDRQLSSAIRERMIAIRNEVLEGQHGRQALRGYDRRPPERPLAIDRIS
jgi:hypothetical protein